MTFATIGSEKTLDRLPSEGEWTMGPREVDYRKMKVFERPMVFGAGSVFADKTVFRAPCVFAKNMNLYNCKIAAGSYIGDGVWLRESSTIGSDCLFSLCAEIDGGVKVDLYQSMGGGELQLRAGWRGAKILPVYGGGALLTIGGYRHDGMKSFVKEIQKFGGDIWRAYTLRQAVLEASKKLSEAATYPRSILAMEGA